MYFDKKKLLLDVSRKSNYLDNSVLESLDFYFSILISALEECLKSRFGGENWKKSPIECRNLFLKS